MLSNVILGRVSVLTLLACVYALTARAQVDVDFLVEEQVAATGHADVLVVFDRYPDLSGAKALATKEEKGRFVFEALRQNALRHRGLLAALGQRGVATEHLWIANAVHVPAADRATLRLIQRTAEVERVAAVTQWQIDGLEREQATAAPTVQSRSNVPEWGIRYMGADEVWAMGYRGEGAVVAGGDTGYDWTHPALREKYRGWRPGADPVHDYNWYDGVKVPFPGTTDANPCGFDVRQPCDDGNHGTHTMGTMVGADDAEEIGVAPGAKWMACRNMDRGNGTPTSYLNCFQFFLAPTNLDGDDPRPELAPDVIANSWYCPLEEGCDSSTYPAFDNVIEALRAAGTVVVVSAGNNGSSGCNTINDIPARVPGAFAVGAHDVNGDIAGFSSRGSYRKDSLVIRPDIAAPGVGVRSSVPVDNYATYSGTSMAGPHVAGMVALMVSANPALRGQVDTIEAMMRRSAVPTAAPATDDCSIPGQDVPNNVFGYGTADARRAVELALAYGGVVSAASAKTTPVRIAPNPTRDRFAVEVPDDLVGGELTVVDVTGRQVLRQRVGQRRVEVEVGDWPASVYVVSVRDAEANYSVKLVVR